MARFRPTEIIVQLNREIGEALAMPEVKRKLFETGIEAGGGSSEAIGQLMRAEAKKWGEVIRSTGSRVD